MFSMRFFFRVLAALALSVFACVPVVCQASMVRLLTVSGPIDIALEDSAAPLTVANFLSYVNSGAYNNTFIHRSVPGFVIQGGGYAASNGTISHITTSAPVQNEFSASRSNVRGTVAMAKMGGDPNSATSEWFINLADNSSNLDNQNGGFTVFGKVTSSGMKVVDAIAALTTVNAGGAFTNLPIVGTLPSSTTLSQGNLVLIKSASVIPASASTSDSDRLFNYLEATYPQYLALPGSASATAAGYYYRYYPATNSYIATANGKVYYLVPSVSGNIGSLGNLADWLSMAASAGY